MSAEDFAHAMAARQSGYGRGGRMKIETDQVQIMGGVRHGRTMGSPIALHITNCDFANWQDAMQVEPLTPGSEEHAEHKAIHSPRPGHADLAGGLKHDIKNMRNVLERASARETAGRVAMGCVAQALLAQFGVQLRGHVEQIGEVRCDALPELGTANDLWWSAVAESPVRCGDHAATQAMMELIDNARQRKDSLGGVFSVHAFGLPAGFGDYAQWDLRLDGRLAQAVMSIPGIKGVESGLGFAMAGRPGSAVHDPIGYEAQQFTRGSNNAGGIEGGMSNGQPIVLRAVMKPIATLMNPLPSVDARSKAEHRGHLERADTCVVPAACVIAEAMTAWVLADALLTKCGGDALPECQRNYANYCEHIAQY